MADKQKRENLCRNIRLRILIHILAWMMIFAGGCERRQEEGKSGTEAAAGGADSSEGMAEGKGECGNHLSDKAEQGDSGSDEGEGEAGQDLKEAPEIEGLACKSRVELEYAQGFQIYRYSKGCCVVDVKEGLSYLVVPDGTGIPDHLPDGMVVLQRPMDHIYVAGTATMAMFHALEGIDKVRFSALEADGWYVDEAKEAMEKGRMKFAGKYDEPDYEMLVDAGCDLAVESQMIYHTPKVMEMLERMDIPVFIDCSSNEGHPLGRVEWIKVYGVLLGKEDEAAAFFKKQTEILEELSDNADTGQSVVYFYINSGGQAVVRTGTDYITKMIEIAGGRYPFESLKDESGSTVAITMEEFYSVASQADYLIYNASIDNRLRSIGELTARNEILKDLKAVKEGNVFCTDKDFYQASDIAAEMIRDIHIMLTKGDEDQMTFLYRVSE